MLQLKVALISKINHSDMKDSESVQCRAITDITRGVLGGYIYRHTCKWLKNVTKRKRRGF